MVTLIFDRSATEFGQDSHPEQPARLINTEAYLLEEHPNWLWMRPRQATAEEVLRAHRPEHLERLRQPIDFDADTPYYPGVDEHARRAAGAAIVAVDLALGGKQTFSLMRPPGHHATPTKAMGFCYLNSVAIAAEYALAAGFTNTQGIQGPAIALTVTSSIGRSFLVAIHKRTFRPPTSHWTVCSTLIPIFCWYPPVSMHSSWIRSRT
jgi:hypothetical protein